MSRHLKNFLLPVLAGVYPVVFLYNHNVQILELANIVKPLVLITALAVILFGAALVLQRKSLQASFSAAILLLFFFLYGPLFQFLLKVVNYEIEHFTLLPLVVSLAVYTCYLATFIRPKPAAAIQNILLLVLVVIICYNVATSVPAEIEKAKMGSVTKYVVQAASMEEQKRPDIYYIVFDEYAGFNAVREYWHDDYVNDFAGFLEDKGFFVAQNSRSSSHDSLVEIASRLNIQQYTDKFGSRIEFFKLIANNKVMSMMQSLGYTTVVFNGLKWGYPGMTEFPVADYYYDVPPKTSQVGWLAINDFDKMVADNTMLGAFELFPQDDFYILKFRNMLLFSISKTANLSDVESPKFVYTHLLFPHTPFLYDEMGWPLETYVDQNWNYYLGQHKYATKLAKNLITQILANADPENPPIIILQSDHGVRNNANTPQSIPLNNYPEKYKTDIMNALYLPGYDYSKLSDTMDPLETFIIVLNHYFKASVTASRP